MSFMITDMPQWGTFSKASKCPNRQLTPRALFGHKVGMIRTGIRRLREARDLSQEDLADALGTSRDYMGKLERGDKRLNLEWIERIAEVLAVEPYELLIADAPPEADPPWSPPEEMLEEFLSAAVPFLLEAPDPKAKVPTAALGLASAIRVFADRPELIGSQDAMKVAVAIVIEKLGGKRPGTSPKGSSTQGH